MATRQDALGLNVASPAAKTAAIGGLRFDWIVVAASTWLVGGAFIDGWAHSHGKVDDSFFTPWHAVFYTGYLVCALVIMGTMIINRSRGLNWSEALPKGYRLSLIGVALFAVGGVGDMIWHKTFGIEKSIEISFSPSHLLLIISMSLIFSGLVRAGWSRPDNGQAGQRDLRSLLPTLIGVTFCVSILHFITQFMHPFSQYSLVTSLPSAVVENRNSVGLSAAGFVIEGGLLVGAVLFLLRRWSLPFGSVTFMFTLNALMMSTQRDTYVLIPAAILAGLAADYLILRWKLSPENTQQLRVFAIVVPFVLYGLHFWTLFLLQGIAWTIHVWAGTLVYTAGAVLLLSLLAVPPKVPAPTPASAGQ
jgi:hypothetical protein